MDTTTMLAPQHPLLGLCERLGARLDELGDPGLWSLSDGEVAELVAATETQVRRLQAWRAKAVGEAQRRDLAKTVGATSTTAWLSGTLTLTPQRAKRLDRLAEALDHGVQATAAAFAAGRVDAEQAEVIATAVHGLPDSVGAETRGQAEAFLLDQADTHHAKTLAGLAGHLLEVVAPDLAEAQLAERLERAEAREAHLQNTFTGSLDRNGQMAVRGRFDAESWAQIQAALEPLAKPSPTVDADGVTTADRRTVGQRQADALVELCRQALCVDGLLPASHGYPAHVAITIDYPALVKAAGVGMLDTGAPISARDVRRVCCDAMVLPVVLGADGVPLDVGRLQRLFSKELHRSVVIRDIGCAFPGCARPASWCQVHHIVHWLDGGHTCLDNGVMLCGAHHRLIHRGQWHVRLGRDRRPEFLPPTWIDPHRTPRRNTCHLRC